MAGVGTPNRALNIDRTPVILRNCVIANGATSEGIYVNEGAVFIYNTTIDGCTNGIRVYGGEVFLENVVLGGNDANGTDLKIDNAGLVRGRNVVFNAATEMGYGTYARQFKGVGFYIEDYDGTKGAWRGENYFVARDAFAAASTPAGKRAGGADTVIKVNMDSAVAMAWDNVIKVAEFVLNQGATGTPDVTVYIQPDNAGASVPDTEGANADVWAEVLAWDVALGEYKKFDSRDKAAQTAQVDETWNDIIVENVEVDAPGTIIVRVFCRSIDLFYVDRVVEVD